MQHKNRSSYYAILSVLCIDGGGMGPVLGVGEQVHPFDSSP